MAWPCVIYTCDIRTCLKWDSPLSHLPQLLPLTNAQLRHIFSHSRSLELPVVCVSGSNELLCIVINFYCIYLPFILAHTDRGYAEEIHLSAVFLLAL